MEFSQEEKNKILAEEKLRHEIRESLQKEEKESFFKRFASFASLLKNLVISLVVILVVIIGVGKLLPVYMKGVI